MGNHPSNTEEIFANLFKLKVFKYDEHTGYVYRMKIFSFNSKNGICSLNTPRRAEKFTPQGYGQLVYTKDKKVYHCMAHRVIWYLYRGAIPVGFEMNHINGNKKDNHLSNLELVTSSQNQIHAYRILGRMPTRGTAILNIDEVKIYKNCIMMVTLINSYQNFIKYLMVISAR